MTDEGVAMGEREQRKFFVITLSDGVRTGTTSAFTRRNCPRETLFDAWCYAAKEQGLRFDRENPGGHVVNYWVECAPD